MLSRFWHHYFMALMVVLITIGIVVATVATFIIAINWLGAWGFIGAVVLIGAAAYAWTMAYDEENR